MYSDYCCTIITIIIALSLPYVTPGSLHFLQPGDVTCCFFILYYPFSFPCSYTVYACRRVVDKCAYTHHPSTYDRRKPELYFGYGIADNSTQGSVYRDRHHHNLYLATDYKKELVDVL